MFRGVILLNIHINQDVGLDVFFYEIIAFVHAKLQAKCSRVR